MNDQLAHTRAVIQQGIDQGLHLGAQLYVSRAGSVLADLALGEARDGVAMTADTVNLWMSSVKPMAAIAIAQLWERGKLDLDDPVARHIHEFGARGKERVTIRHLLTHTGGFRAVIGLGRDEPYEQVVAQICEAPLEPRWIPGQTAGYHTHTAWYILAELVRRVDHRPFDQYVREDIFRPCGMEDCWVGMPVEAYRAYGRRIGFMYDTSGPELRSAPASNSEEDAAAVRPGSNGRGPIRQLGRFYEMLMKKGVAMPSPAGDGSPRRILRPQTVEAMVARHRVGIFDLTFKHVMDWGLGFILNSNQYGEQTVPYGFGPHAGRRTFGHSGHQSSCAFCDPDEQLVVAWMCNGMPDEPRHDRRLRQINASIYQDLGLIPQMPTPQPMPRTVAESGVSLSVPR